MSQYLNHFALGTFPPCAVVGKLHHNLMPCHRSPGVLQRNKNVLCDPLVIRNHKAIAFTLLKGPHHLGNAMSQDLRNDTLTASAASRMSLDRYLHRIPQKRIVGILLSDENILLLILHRHKAKALGMTGKDACDGLFLGFAVAASLGKGNFPLCQKLLQGPRKLLPALPGHLQHYRQLLLLHRYIAGIADKFIYNPFLFFQNSVIHILSV